MKRLILIGRSGCGKTTLTQRLRGETLRYRKTQDVQRGETLIDTPGEYFETHVFGRALALYSYEADIVALLLSACEPFSLYAPCVAASANRPVIGVVTKIDRPDGDPERAERWLRLAGCETVFFVSSNTGEGVQALAEYLA